MIQDNSDKDAPFRNDFTQYVFVTVVTVVELTLDRILDFVLKIQCKLFSVPCIYPGQATPILDTIVIVPDLLLIWGIILSQ